MHVCISCGEIQNRRETGRIGLLRLLRCQGAKKRRFFSRKMLLNVNWEFGKNGDEKGADATLDRLIGLPSSIKMCCRKRQKCRMNVELM